MIYPQIGPDIMCPDEKIWHETIIDGDRPTGARVTVIYRRRTKYSKTCLRRKPTDKPIVKLIEGRPSTHAPACLENSEARALGEIEIADIKRVKQQA